MKLAAIYNVFDGVELLEGSMNCIKYHVDTFIIVYQDVSNFGESYNPLLEMEFLKKFNHTLIKYNPVAISGPHVGTENETAKRNVGIEEVKKQCCTHFLQLDCDEYYSREAFADAKEFYRYGKFKGSVCKMYNYFKEPTLRFDSLEDYYVPFIHELNQDTVTGINEYPFYCDKTRQVNEKDVVLLPLTMHHFSWVRKDINRKCSNSSAKHTFQSGTLLRDYHSDLIKEGFFVRDAGKTLVRVENTFNIHI